MVLIGWSHRGRPAAIPGRVNAQRSDAGWVTDRNRFPGRVVGRRSVVGMAPTIIVIRRSTDEGGTQTLPAQVEMTNHLAYLQ